MRPRARSICPSEAAAAALPKAGCAQQSAEVCRPLVSYGRDTIDMQVAAPHHLPGRLMEPVTKSQRALQHRR